MLHGTSLTINNPDAIASDILLPSLSSVIITTGSYSIIKKLSKGKACPDGQAVWGAATGCYLSLTTAWVRNPAGAYEKLASDLGIGGDFCQLLRFPPPLTTG